MFALIRKDLIACRLFLVVGFALYVLWAISMYQQPLGYFVLHIAATIVLALMPMVVDDKYRANSLICLLPPSRRKVVMARYLVVLIALFVGLSSHYGLGAILSNRFEETGFWTLCKPQALLVFCLVPIIVASIYLPCFFRFGLGRGAFAFAIVIVAFTTLITSPLIATDVLSAHNGFVFTREMQQHPEMAVVGIVDQVAAAVGSGRFYGAASIGSVLLVFASVVLSIRFLQRRDF